MLCLCSSVSIFFLLILFDSKLISIDFFLFGYPNRSSPKGQVDLMSRAIETRSYKQALMGQRATSCAPASAPLFGLGSTVTPTLPQSFTGNSPLTSPFKAPSRAASLFLTPSMNNYVIDRPAGTATSQSSSASSLAPSKNPHINPLIFGSPGITNIRNLGSPSTVCTSTSTCHSSARQPTKFTSPSKKRPSAVIDLDSDQDQEHDHRKLVLFS
ncbi:hypothetical protein DFH28DRAFT_886047 [Melampsora americana]|nr:hypothetical protein DFH28DRAFT_886047 [Melampsora americana]